MATHPFNHPFFGKEKQWHRETRATRAPRQPIAKVLPLRLHAGCAGDRNCIICARLRVVAGKGGAG
jgi:hypothetical protein